MILTKNEAHTLMNALEVAVSVYQHEAVKALMNEKNKEYLKIRCRTAEFMRLQNKLIKYSDEFVGD